MAKGKQRKVKGIPKDGTPTQERGSKPIREGVSSHFAKSLPKKDNAPDYRRVARSVCPWHHIGPCVHCDSIAAELEKAYESGRVATCDCYICEQSKDKTSEVNDR